MGIVTVFGQPSSLAMALADELESRDFVCHLVSAPLGWWEASTSSVVFLVDSATGSTALEGLAANRATDQPSEVLVMASADAPEATVALWRDWCMASAAERRVTLVWYPPLGSSSAAPAGYASAAVRCFLDGGEGSDEIWLDRIAE